MKQSEGAFLLKIFEMVLSHLSEVTGKLYLPIRLSSDCRRVIQVLYFAEIFHKLVVVGVARPLKPPQRLLCPRDAGEGRERCITTETVPRKARRCINQALNATRDDQQGQASGSLRI